VNSKKVYEKLKIHEKKGPRVLEGAESGLHVWWTGHLEKEGPRDYRESVLGERRRGGRFGKNPVGS